MRGLSGSTAPSFSAPYFHFGLPWQLAWRWGPVELELLGYSFVGPVVTDSFGHSLGSEVVAGVAAVADTVVDIEGCPGAAEIGRDSGLVGRS